MRSNDGRTMRIVRLLLLAGLFGLVAPAGAGAQPAPPLHEIQVVGLQFVPAVTTVAAGQAVIWTNREAADYEVVRGVHNVVRLVHVGPDGTVVPASAPVCPVFGPGETCTRTAGSAALPVGTHLYACTINELHFATMRAAIVVR